MSVIENWEEGEKPFIPPLSVFRFVDDNRGDTVVEFQFWRMFGSNQRIQPMQAAGLLAEGPARWV